MLLTIVSTRTRAFGPSWRTAFGHADGRGAHRGRPGAALRPAGHGPRQHRRHGGPWRADRRARKRTEEHTEGEKPVVRERVTGSFTRRVRLGDAADSAKVEAGYQDGVLTVRVPLAETAQAAQGGDPDRRAQGIAA